MKVSLISFMKHLTIICSIVAYLKLCANFLFDKQLKITKKYTDVELFAIS